MHDLNDLYYFVQVVDYGGFAPAGRALNISKSKLSRRVALLEHRLGTRLLQRSTRHFSVTDIGYSYHAHCKAMLAEAGAAQEAIELNHAEPRGLLKLSCTVSLLGTSVGLMLADFMALHPLIDIHLEATNRHVDVISDGVDIAIRVCSPPLPDSDMVLRVLAERGLCLVASLPLLHRYGIPRSPSDLQRLPSVDMGEPQREHVWNLHGPGEARADVVHRPRFITRSVISLREAAIAGVGVAAMPLMMVVDELASGDLVRLLPDWAPESEIVHAVFASRRGLAPTVRALLDFLVLRFTALNGA